MTQIAVDTNGYRALVEGDSAVRDVLERAETVVVPFVVLAELTAGFHFGTRTRENESTLAQFLDKPGVQVLWPDRTTIHHYAGLYRQLRRQGTPIPTNDLWIAAIVVQHDLSLLTGDRHFDHLPQLQVVTI